MTPLHALIAVVVGVGALAIVGLWATARADRAKRVEYRARRLQRERDRQEEGL